MGYWCAVSDDCHSHVLPTTDGIQITSPRSHCLCLPPSWAAGSGRLRGDATGQSLYEYIPCYKYIASGRSRGHEAGSHAVCDRMGASLIMWGFAIVWLFFAVASISRSKFPFNMGWWGFTFPLGVLTLSTTTIGKETESRFFNVLGTVCQNPIVLNDGPVITLATYFSCKGICLRFCTAMLKTQDFHYGSCETNLSRQIFSVVVTLLWILVAFGTLRKLFTGELLFAPCLKDIEDFEPGRAERQSEERVIP